MQSRLPMQPEPAMRCQDEKRDAVPVTRDDERPVIQIQKILHASYECGVFLGRNHPARFQMGLEFVFLSARCTVR